MAEQKKLLTKRARKQADEIEVPDYVHINGDYNIWYHKRLGDKPLKKQEKSATKLNVKEDAGWTKADLSPGHHYICLYFAKGKCVNGENCQFFHRLPTEEDERQLPLTHDIFGRERHKTDREDMGGVGCYNRDNRTLYIGGLKSQHGPNLEKIIREEFSVFGEIEYLRVIFQRMIAFVRYKFRSSAEFAKEAMADQSLGQGEVINVRWSHEDPNPLAQKHQDLETTRKAAEAILERTIEMGVPSYALTQIPNLTPQPHPYTLRPSVFLPKSRPPSAPPLENFDDVVYSATYYAQYYQQCADYYAQYQINDIPSIPNLNQSNHNDGDDTNSGSGGDDSKNEELQQQEEETKVMAYQYEQYYRQWAQYYETQASYAAAYEGISNPDVQNDHNHINYSQLEYNIKSYPNTDSQYSSHYDEDNNNSIHQNQTLEEGSDHPSDA